MWTAYSSPAILLWTVYTYSSHERSLTRPPDADDPRVRGCRAAPRRRGRAAGARGRRVRHAVVRNMPCGATGNRVGLGQPPGRASSEDPRRPRAAARPIVRGEALADAGVPARRPGDRA